MQLTDHIQHLLRDHDCVIIPDFGGLIADYEPARLHPVRHTLAPPAKRVAFNQALTRNDGLLVDAISRQCGLSAAQARQVVREAVARMQQELDEQQRTELSGIGVFRRSAGRGLDFEYTGHHNLLPASYGLPELTSRPVRATDAMIARERNHQAPAPMLAPARKRLMRRVLSSVVGVSMVGLLLSANMQFAQRMGYWPEGWWPNAPETTAAVTTPKAQAATLPAPAWEEEVVPDGAPESQPELNVSAPAPAPATTAPAATPAAKTAAVATPAPAAASVAAPTSAVANAEKGTISGVTNRWYVVIGSFNTLRSVEQARQNLVRKGKPAAVLMPRRGTRQVRGSRYYRLTVADFADQSSATRSLPAMRKQFGKDILVLNY